MQRIPAQFKQVFSCKGTSTYRPPVGAARCMLSLPQVRSVVAGLARGVTSQRADRAFCPFLPPPQQELCPLSLCQHKLLLPAAHAHHDFTLLTGMVGFPFKTSGSALLAPVRMHQQQRCAPSLLPSPLQPPRSNHHIPGQHL